MSAQQELKIYKLDDVAVHNKEDDCWLAIDGLVYDVTKFLNFHPAGKQVILTYAGKDATQIFHYFHAKIVLTKYKKFVIGKIDPTELPAIKAPILKFKNSFGEGIPFGDPNSVQGWFSPFYNESHHKLRAAAREWVQKEIAPYVDSWDESYNIPKELFKKAGQQGIYKAVMGKYPTNFVDNNRIFGVEIEKLDSFHEMIIIEEICKPGSDGIIWGLVGGISIGLPPILKFASRELQQKYMRPVLEGDKLICLAITEPWAGSDVSGIRTKAILSEDKTHYVVTGMKKFITTAIYSDAFTVAVRTGGPGHGGISLLVIDAKTPGVKVRKMKMQGVWCSGTSFITFDEVKVPVSQLIGQEGQGFNYIMQNFNHERLTLCVESLALARVAYEESMSYAHKRKTFGKTLISHPVIRNKIAHMVRQIESAYALMEQVIYNFDTMNEKQSNSQLAGTIAILKAHTTQVLENVATEAVQIHGGQGYTRGALGGKVERIYRDTKAMTQGGGTPEILYDLGVRQASKLMPQPRL
ncbi:Cytochrome b5-like heme/steroid binding domain [Pseudocohnilembus persalinus]|uniref:Cytochrome b5-like heme/steroid binding domain n=1 Tax=Pseudocohnilembus persalinus TaxID=266149 RepID=A0A0V0QNV0_PSEPJ|nr:Cytochrome b5-like heme/steroid binding domain [Pseudocohnilembus persalinus]|eukprot:KRX03942.1 Cytochrome b5-like heme/steroid binding domain [Pseudocohnilembus persalinus]